MDDLFGVTELADKKIDTERGVSVDNNNNDDNNKNNIEHREHATKGENDSNDIKPTVSEVEHR